jgi:hypothetical protein
MHTSGLVSVQISVALLASHEAGLAMTMKSWRPPTPDQIERGVPYFFQLSWATGYPSWIIAEPGNPTVRWHCRTEPCRANFSPQNLIRKPDFVLLDHEEREVLRICRTTRLPPRFNMIQNGEVVGTIGLRSIFQNKYAINLKAGPKWTFRMPLFTVYFHGASSSNSRVWVIVGPSKMEWSLLTEAGTDDLRLLAGLAFIHREWWCL